MVIKSIIVVAGYWRDISGFELRFITECIASVLYKYDIRDGSLIRDDGAMVQLRKKAYFLLIFSVNGVECYCFVLRSDNKKKLQQAG